VKGDEAKCIFTDCEQPKVEFKGSITCLKRHLKKHHKDVLEEVENLTDDEYNQIGFLIKFLLPFRIASKYFEKSSFQKYLENTSSFL
jgi:hypothetical protein